MCKIRQYDVPVKLEFIMVGSFLCNRSAFCDKGRFGLKYCVLNYNRPDFLEGCFRGQKGGFKTSKGATLKDFSLFTAHRAGPTRFLIPTIPIPGCLPLTALVCPRFRDGRMSTDLQFTNSRFDPDYQG